MNPRPVIPANRKPRHWRVNISREGFEVGFDISDIMFEPILTLPLLDSAVAKVCALNALEAAS